MTTYVTTLPTPIGEVGLASDGDHLVALSLPNYAPPEGVPDGAPLADAVAQLESYFAGELREFDLPLKAEGTAFQRSVWDALCEIPYGETASYKEVAIMIGQPTATRAVGSANGANPLAIIVPCHRVIAANGTLGGYGGGLPAKQALLDLERNALDRPPV